MKQCCSNSKLLPMYPTWRRVIDFPRQPHQVQSFCKTQLFFREYISQINDNLNDITFFVAKQEVNKKALRYFLRTRLF